MSSGPHKSAFSAPLPREGNKRGSPTTSTKDSKLKPAGAAVGAAKGPPRESTGARTTQNAGEILKRRLERLKRDVKDQPGAAADTRGRGVPGNRTGAKTSRVDSPGPHGNASPTPLHTSTPTFARRMSENDPRRNIIKSSVYNRRKASMPAQSPRTGMGIPPSPLAASTSKPTRTLKRQRSDQLFHSKSSPSTTPRGSMSEKGDARSQSRRTTPKSSSPKTNSVSGNLNRSQKTTPRGSDVSRTSTPDQMIRRISQENLERELASPKDKQSSFSSRNPTQKQIHSGGSDGGGLPQDRKDCDVPQLSLSNPKLSYVSDNCDGDNNTNMELELRSLKSESECSVLSERSLQKRTTSTRDAARDAVPDAASPEAPPESSQKPAEEALLQPATRALEQAWDHDTEQAEKPSLEAANEGSRKTPDIHPDPLQVIDLEVKGQEIQNAGEQPRLSRLPSQEGDKVLDEGEASRTEDIEVRGHSSRSRSHSKSKGSEGDERMKASDLHLEGKLTGTSSQRDEKGRRMSRTRSQDTDVEEGLKISDLDLEVKPAEHDEKGRRMSRTRSKDTDEEERSKVTSNQKLKGSTAASLEQGERKRRRSRTRSQDVDGEERSKINDLELEESPVAFGMEERLMRRRGSNRRRSDSKEEGPRDGCTTNGHGETTDNNPPENTLTSPSPRAAEDVPTDKMIKLKQRNAELAVMAKRLEEKAKEMQNRPSAQWKRMPSTESAPLVLKTHPLSPSNQDPPSSLPPGSIPQGPPTDVEQMKRMMVAKQRAKELAESQARALLRDRELQNLRQDVEALKKELLIKKQDELIEGDLQRSSFSTGNSALKLKALEESNSALREELQKVREESKSISQRLEVEVSQQRKTFDALERDLCEERQKSNQLALDLQQAVNQNAHLTKQLGDLHRKFSLLDQVLEECRQLREDFCEQRQILHSTIAERDWLRDSVVKLNSDIGLMQAAEEKRQQLEREHEEALRDLQQKQDDIRRLQMEQAEAKKQHRESVSRLEHKVQDLEQLWLEQCHNFGHLSQELSALRQHTSSQLQTLVSGSAAARSTLGLNPASVAGGAAGAAGQSKEAELEDWRRIAEEARVTRAAKQGAGAATVGASVPDAADISQGSESSSHRSGGRPGQIDSLSEPGDLLDELSDKIDRALLTKLHHASVSSGPISKLAVFIARYNYNPAKDSPNDNNDSELPLTAGDYIYVYGDPDEDGFYEGELMDGRRGLVPCNFIERIAEENLPDFMQYNGSQCDEDPLSELDFNSEEVDARRANLNHFSGDAAFARAQADHPSDLEDIPEVDEDDDNHHASGRRGDEGSLASFSDFGSDVSFIVPCPRKLSLDRQLKHSVILSWVAPDTVTLQEILEFRVYVDGQYRTATKQGAKTRALVEGVEPTVTYRVSVRTVTAKGMSEDAACMLLIGRDASVAPSNLKASSVGPSSANISWLPGNSNLPHVVSVNGEEVRTLKPGIYKHKLSDLQPLSVYRVNVKAKSRRQSAKDSSPANFTEIEFKTLPGGLPDAPLDVQVKQSSNDGFLSVEWLPVTLTTSSLSNGAVIMGYAVFVNNNKVAEAISPTADRLSVSKSKLRMLSAKELVVRTLSPNGSSHDSMPAKLSSDLLEEKRKEKTSGKVATGTKVNSSMYNNADEDDSSSSATSSQRSQGRNQGGGERRGQVEEGDNLERFSQKVASSPRMEVTPREEPPQTKQVTKPEKPALVVDPDYLSASDSDRSELSDIQEVAEEEEEEEFSEFGNASLPGLSDSSEGAKQSLRRRNRVDDEKKKVQETLQYNTKLGLDFDTDPEVESLNKPDKVVPIPIIRSQRDYERETEQSPHNPVVEPVPWKPAKTVPQIEITKDANHEHIKAAAPRSTDLYTPEKRTEVIRTTSPVSSASNSLPLTSPRPDARGQTKGKGQRWDGSSAASNSETGSRSKNYDAKSNNDRQHLPTGESRSHSEASRDRQSDRHHGSGESRSHSEASSHRQSDRHHPSGDSRSQSDHSSHRQSEGSHRQQASRHSDSLNTPDSSLSQRKSPRASRSSEFGEDDEEEEEEYSGSEPEELFDDGTIRFFVAVFDYNPAIMSPNIDGAEEELSFKEGDVIKIIGDKDSDGFFVGEMNGRRGYVPCNMVEEIDSPDQTPVSLKGSAASRAGDSQGHDRKKFDESFSSSGNSHVNLYDSPPSNGDLLVPPDAEPHQMRALFDYNPQELSPNPDLDMELSFRQGERITVFGEMDEVGFFVGELRGKRGLVPSNFLEEVSEMDSSSASRSYSPSFSRNQENKHPHPHHQATKDKYALPALQQENGQAQYHGGQVTSSPGHPSVTPQVIAADPTTPEHTKKKKGLLSKGKALFKKLGSSDNKQRHK